MKRFLILLFCFLSLSLSAQDYNVLFIGNSYTSYNNLPQLVQDVLGDSHGNYHMSSSTPGGCNFQNHLTQSFSYIKQGGWDYVILQDQSQAPSFPDSQFMEETYPYAQQLCDSVRKYSPNAQIIFYMTWGRQNGDSYNCQFFPPLCTYEGMDSLLYLRYMIMAEDNEAAVSPVGALWHYIRDNYPDINLYQSDESHPALVGSYAAACSFYTLLTHDNPVNITANCGVNIEQAEIIRNCAKIVVYDSLNKWLFPTVIIPFGVEDIEDNSLLTIYPNPTSQTLFIEMSSLELPSYDVKIYDINGILCGQFLNNKETISNFDISFLNSGMYFFVVSSYDKQQIAAKKFLKK